ncbi:cytoplasmic dynein 2 heavy chain 1-like [Oopsacas minuta]|uniref:Cytoplasmic dynein 2 heavy chain 1 n=1 Tax=Oopsacas minuta TaxID=111878 RepID=A0AAV7K353_9METZ|nr:cytoplasmic dynein 2 heavy chain 1-like [Oopsacas minuta]
MADHRKQILLSSIQQYFGDQFGKSHFVDISESSQLNSFLDDANTSLLLIQYCNNTGACTFEAFNYLDTSVIFDRLLVFIKPEPMVLSLENMRSQFLMCSLLDSPIDFLNQIIQKFYLPSFFQPHHGQDSIHPNLLYLLSQIESHLSSSVRHEIHYTGTSVEGNASTLEESKEFLSQIHSPFDEQQHWVNISKETTSHELRDRAHFIQRTLSPVVKEFSSFPYVLLPEILDCLDSIFISFDEIWTNIDIQPPYPEIRMSKLIQVCTSSLLCVFSQRFSILGVWFSETPIIKQSLFIMREICTKWLENCVLYTGHIWRKFLQHPWQGPVLSNDSVDLFVSRIDELTKYRNIYEQTQEMLTIDECEASELFSVFDSFSGLSPLQLNPLTDTLWMNAVYQFNLRMRPSETIVAEKIIQKVRQIQSFPMHVLREFDFYHEILQLPIVKVQLSNERESLLSLLIHYINNLTQLFEGNKLLDSNQHHVYPLYSKNSHCIISSLLFLAQTSSEIQFLLQACPKHLQDLANFHSFMNNLTQLKERVFSLQSEQFESWCRDILNMIDEIQSPFVINFNVNSLVEFDSIDGHLIVFYHDKLIQLLREVRNISALGFVIPSNILRISSVAEKYFQIGIILKQIAQFYNTIHNQIIPSQQPLLISSSVKLDALLRNSNIEGINVRHDKKMQVDWESPVEIYDYVSKLQKFVEAFSLENRRLRCSHFLLIVFVENLYGLNLLEHHSKWKHSLSEIRELIHRVQLENGYDNSHMHAWHFHWDFQLFKVLEYWYTHCLQHLHDLLPDIKIDLVVRNDSLMFRPPLEEVRSRYLREIRHFLCIPRTFRGVTTPEKNPGKLYSQIIEHNSTYFLNIYKLGENLMIRLRRVLSIYEPWVVFASGLFNNVQEEYCRTVHSFENCFKLLKVKGYEASNLPNSIRIECISISAIQAKSSIDAMFHHLFDLSLMSLKDSLKDRYNTVNTFISDAELKLNVKPQNIEEVSFAYGIQKCLIQKRVEMQSVLFDLHERSKLLRLIEGSQNSDYTSIKQNLSLLNSNWDKIEVLIEAQENIINGQIEVMKDRTKMKQHQITMKISKFSEKWSVARSDIAENVLQSSLEIEAEEQFQYLADFNTEFKEISQCVEEIANECEYLSISKPQFPILQELQVDYCNFETVWKLWHEFIIELQTISSELWLNYRSKCIIFGTFLKSWDEKCRKHLPIDKYSILTALISKISSYSKILPVFHILKGDSYTPEHWCEMFCIIGIPKHFTFENIAFREFLTVIPAIIQNEQIIIDLNVKALGEVSIRNAINEVELWSVSVSFSLSPYLRATNEDITILTDLKETVNEVSENLCLLQSIKDSKYFNIFKERSMIWEDKLLNIDLYIQRLIEIQRKWLYLEPIFGNESFPRERDRFRQVDKSFCSILAGINKSPLLFSLLKVQGLLITLDGCLDQLNRCQKAMLEYIEEKRNSFPRFFFIGDEDLLEILGQTNNFQLIQNILPKLFAGINTVSIIGDNPKCIESMNSFCGEVVFLCHNIQISTTLEVWLTQLTNEMNITLSNSLYNCLSSTYTCTNSINDSISSQVLTLSELIHFTDRCEQAIPRGELSKVLTELESQLKYFAENKFNPRENSSFKVLEIKRKSLVMDSIRCIDILKYLQVDPLCSSINDWKWKKQLRYYFFDQTPECNICMVDASFSYSFEYLGDPQRLVHTNLTDKCFLTLTQGIWLGMGGNPYGPAGTGKTESVKALGALLGRQVLVFNCDEAIDVKSMSRIFIGIVKCGAWGCFDEFNRLKETVLSALSLQIHIIQVAIQEKSTSILLLDVQVELNPNSGIFITLNPASKGYCGRQNLPDNLKRLFLPIAMSRPDNDRIAEVLLYSEGFVNSKILATKLVGLFSLAKELLSYQNHYDWGLRSLKTVLEGAGTLLENARIQFSENLHNHTAAMEFQFIIQSVRYNTLSKLTHSDCRRFNALIRDFFPGIDIEDVLHQELTANLEKYILDNGFSPLPNQIQKCIELYQQLQRKMGILLIGPSGSGKSFIWKALKGTLNMKSQNIISYCVNPKAVSHSCLFGSLDNYTREWTDGIIPLYSRKIVKEPIGIHSWLVCDGDIDTVWIESLNSVLDDNRLLTMQSGERIQFGPNVNFIFESHNLNSASPATISRLGMIFLRKEEIDYRAITTSWLELHISRFTKSLQTLILNCIEQYFYSCLDIVIHSGNLVIECSQVGLLYNGLSHVLLVKSKEDFAIAMIRGFGSNLHITARTQFAREVMAMMNFSLPNPGEPCNVYYDLDTFTFRSYQFDISHNPEIVFADVEYSTNPISPLILTSQVQMNIDLFQIWLKSDYNPNFILAGPDGCGKEALLLHCIGTLYSTKLLCIHCNSNTTPNEMKIKLFDMCISYTSNSGRVLRPKDCERLIVLIKSINLPKPDKWGSVQFISFLQQMSTYSGFYDSNFEWITVENIQIIATLCPAERFGRYSVTTRLTSIFRICYISYLDLKNLHSICQNLLVPILKTNIREHSNESSICTRITMSQIGTLTSSMLHLYEKSCKINQSLSIVFTPRHLTEWMYQFQRYLCSSENVPTIDDVLRIWIYEANRVFCDRLSTSDSREEFKRILNEILSNDWNTNLKSLTSSQELYYISPSIIEPFSFLGCTFTRLVRTDENALHDIFSSIVLNYGNEVENLDVYIFHEVLLHFAQIDRVISTLSGSLLLCGKSGVGRHLALKLVAFYHKIEIISPLIGKRFGLKQFTQLLKSVLLKCGVEDKQVIFSIEDYQILDSRFMDIINSLLISSEVPGLFRRDELTSIISSIQEQALEEGYMGNLQSYFYKRIKQNLHIVLIIDISSHRFPSIFDGNPALSSNCSLIIMEDWSPESICLIPKLCFKSMNLDTINSLSISSWCVDIFSSVNTYSPTPRRFLAFLHLFSKLYTKELHSNTHQMTRLLAGLQKINEASQNVEILKLHAAQQEVLLSEKQKEASSALQLVTNSMEQASLQKIEMEALSRNQAEERRLLEVRKHSIELELSEIMPLVQQSKSAISALNPESIREIRTLRAPPEVIRDILEGVLRLMGIYDTSWNSMKAFLSKRGIKEDICQLDVRNISHEIRNGVEEFINSRKKSFEPNIAKRASVAAAPLASWVISTLKYSQVLESIKPLEDKQNKLSKNLLISEKKIEKLSIGLSNIDKEIAQLKTNFEQYTEDAAKLKLDVCATQTILNTSENLVNKLDNEKIRWTIQQDLLQTKNSNLLSRCLLASSYISFLGSTNETERETKSSEWKLAIDYQEDFNITTFLSNENEHLFWRYQGLPTDNLSVCNAIILKNTLFCPYLIDPSHKAFGWLREHLSGERLEIVNFNDDKFTTMLELSVRFGKRIIILDVDDIEPILYPLIRREIYFKGSSSFVYIGEKQVDFNNDFKMYLITRNPNPNINVDIQSCLSIINFSFTIAGLTSQLLTIIILTEKPELEVQKTNILSKEEKLRCEILSLEEILLNDLASSEGNILENSNLLASLNETKEKSTNISTALIDSKVLQDNIDIERDYFLPLARKGSQIYVILENMSQINHMYRYSLESFISLFKLALGSQQDNHNPDAKLFIYSANLQSIVYDSVSLSVFKRDLLTFALHFVHGLHENLFNIGEWEYFCGIFSSYTTNQDISSELNSEYYNQNIPSWCGSDCETAINRLKSTFPSLYSLLDLHNETLWLEFARSTQCEHLIPATVINRLTAFQKLIIIQSLRPDCLKAAIEAFCGKVLGSSNICSPSLNLRKIITESVSSNPILIMVSPGADPSQELQDIASETIGQENYIEIPIGEGQEDYVIQRLKECSVVECWLCLKNLHMVIDFVPNIERCYRHLEKHKNFRLILTSEQHKSFCINLLNISLKISYEIPLGVKNNMIRTYQHWSSEYISQGNNPKRSKLLFALTWFHVVLQERCNFIPQGWSQFYDFSLSDLRAAAKFVDKICISRTPEFCGTQWWEFIHGILENAIFGGRIDNTMDMRIYTSFLNEFFNDRMFSKTHSFGPFKSIAYSSDKNDYFKSILCLSSEKNPSFLGLQTNIDREVQKLECHHVLSQLKLLIIADMKFDQFDRGRWKTELSGIFLLWKDLNKECNLITQQLFDNESNSEFSPLLDFLHFECNTALMLIQTIHLTLTSIKKVLSGTCLISQNVYNISISLMKHTVPSSWSEKWDGPNDPLQYLKIIVRKTLAINCWIKNLESGIFFDSLLNLSDILSPSSFLYVFRQHTSRVSHLSIDDLTFTCRWSSRGKSDVSLHITGLHIEGCIFDGKQITPTKFDSPSSSTIPSCYFAWELCPQIEQSSNHCVILPLYSSKRREYVIAQISLPCSETPDVWIQAGAAIYIQ